MLLAGGLRPEHPPRTPCAVGLLPAEVPGRRVHYEVNTSLARGQAGVLSRTDDARLDALARAVRHVDLSTDPDFATEFAMAMYFPG